MASTFLFLTIPTIPPADGDVLTWNATTGDWEPGVGGGGGGGFTAGGEIGRAHV